MRVVLKWVAFVFLCGTAWSVPAHGQAGMAMEILHPKPACRERLRYEKLPAGSLPNAPSVTLPMVNGCPYEKPTARQDLLAYRHEMIGARPFISAGIRSGIEQLRTKPVGWGQDFPGYAQRYGSAYGESAIDTSVRFGMAAVLHEDTRYLICHRCSASDKWKNAILSEFTTRHGGDGHRAFSPTPIVANFSGPLVAYAAWYPPGYGPEDAAKHSALGFGSRIVGKVVREFLFDRGKE